MRDPEMAPALVPLGMEPVGEGPEAFAKMIAKVVESAGLKPKGQ